MKSRDGWILAFLVLGVVLLYLMGVFRKQEGFAVGLLKTRLRCPDASYTFFNDMFGGSFCCKNSSSNKSQVDPYNHKCSATGDNGLCSFAPNTPDPRSPTSTLPLCSSLASGTYILDGITCPPSLPNFATNGERDLCCKSVIPQTNSGLQCVAADMAEESAEGKKTGYCVARGDPTNTEQSCNLLRATEISKCPDTLVAKGYQKVDYTLTDGTKISACTNIRNTCIPDSVLDVAQGAGFFPNRTKGSWKWSCSTQAKMEGGDYDFTLDENFP